jgi:hypothetical protein
MATDADLFTFWLASVQKNPIAWFLLVGFLITLNTIGWYYRYSLFGDALNHKSATISGAAGDLVGIIIFRLFEYICIFGFIIWLYKYGK